MVRQEGDGLRCYCHIGTGNYHAKTARLYTDLGLFTCDPELTADVVQLFHYLTGRSRAPQFRRLLVAPWNMRDALPRPDPARGGPPQGGSAGAAGGQDESAGGPPDVRGAGGRLRRGPAHRPGGTRDFAVCARECLAGPRRSRSARSSVGSWSTRASSTSPTARAIRADGDYYIGSADWMERNLSGRVEVVTPVTAPALRQRLWEILDTNLRDRRQAWIMTASGDYRRLEPGPGDTRSRRRRHPGHPHAADHEPAGRRARLGRRLIPTGRPSTRPPQQDAALGVPPRGAAARRRPAAPPRAGSG